MFSFICHSGVYFPPPSCCLLKPNIISCVLSQHCSSSKRLFGRQVLEWIASDLFDLLLFLLLFPLDLTSFLSVFHYRFAHLCTVKWVSEICFCWFSNRSRLCVSNHHHHPALSDLLSTFTSTACFSLNSFSPLTTILFPTFFTLSTWGSSVQTSLTFFTLVTILGLTHSRENDFPIFRSSWSKSLHIHLPPGCFGRPEWIGTNLSVPFRLKIIIMTWETA